MGKFGILEWIIIFTIVAAPAAIVLVVVLYKLSKKKKPQPGSGFASNSNVVDNE